MEENQGRESDEETQSCAARSHAAPSPRGPAADEVDPKPAACANSAHGIADVIEAAKEKTAAKMKKRADRQLRTSAKKSQLKANLNGKQYGDGTRKRLKACEALFLEALRRQHPEEYFAEWGPKERGQCKQLIDKYPFEVVEAALRYVVEHWDAIRSRFKVGPFPNIGWLLSMHTSVVPEAQRFARIRQTLDEIAEWRKDNPHDFLPSDLKARYNKIKPELEALGIQ